MDEPTFPMGYFLKKGLHLLRGREEGGRKREGEGEVGTEERDVRKERKLTIYWLT